MNFFRLYCAVELCLVVEPRSSLKIDVWGPTHLFSRIVDLPAIILDLNLAASARAGPDCNFGLLQRLITWQYRDNVGKY
jgi:hypothetical protein